MISLDKFIIRVYRRANIEVIEKVTYDYLINILSECKETDLIYLTSVLIRFHPKLYNNMKNLGENLDVLKACLKTEYYKKLIQVCNDNLDLFNSLVKGNSNAGRAESV